MVLYGDQQIGRPAIMQEEEPLADTPQRRSAELVGSGYTLCHTICQS